MAFGVGAYGVTPYGATPSSPGALVIALAVPIAGTSKTLIRTSPLTARTRRARTGSVVLP